MPISSGGESERSRGAHMPENPLNYSKAEHYRKFQEWKNGVGAHWFGGDIEADDYDAIRFCSGELVENPQKMASSELKAFCDKCHLKDECGECRMPTYIEMARERELYSIHSLCVNCEC